MRMLFLALAAAYQLPASAAGPDIAAVQAALADTAGNWRGDLQYRDYQSDTWQGLPMTLAIVTQPDGVTSVRTAQYDDGPQTGIVTITTVSMLVPEAGMVSYAIFRKKRENDAGSSRIIAFTKGIDGQHWTLVTTERRRDGNQIADVRETTTRDGEQMTTLKEVNPVNDGRNEFFPRNRTVLKAVNAH